MISASAEVGDAFAGGSAWLFWQHGNRIVQEVFDPDNYNVMWQSPVIRALAKTLAGYASVSTTPTGRTKSVLPSLTSTLTTLCKTESATGVDTLPLIVPVTDPALVSQSHRVQKLSVLEVNALMTGNLKRTFLDDSSGSATARALHLVSLAQMQVTDPLFKQQTQCTVYKCNTDDNKESSGGYLCEEKCLKGLGMCFTCFNDISSPYATASIDTPLDYIASIRALQLYFICDHQVLDTLSEQLRKIGSTAQGLRRLVETAIRYPEVCTNITQCARCLSFIHSQYVITHTTSGSKKLQQQHRALQDLPLLRAK
jgi:hypothetical protein